jgi:DNA-directed RNA polymerase specialized sigma24 family protein
MNNPARSDGSRFDNLVARYYPAVYGFAARLTEDPREASDLARAAFRNTRRQLTQLRNQTAIATVLISAVIRAGLGVG